MTKNLSKKIIGKIKSKHLHPKPRWYFYLSSFLFGLSLASVLILTTIFLNLSLFHLPAMTLAGAGLPLFYLSLTALTLVFSLYLFRKNQYRHSLLAIFLGAILFLVIGNYLFTCFRSSRRFPPRLRRFYRHQQLPTPNPRRSLHHPSLPSSFFVNRQKRP